MRKIDTVNNGLQTTDTEVHKINLSGPFSAFRFTVTESYDPSKSWYGEIYRIDFFGVLNPDKHLLNKIYRNTCKSKQSTFLSKTLLILELVLCK